MTPRERGASICRASARRTHTSIPYDETAAQWTPGECFGYACQVRTRTGCGCEAQRRRNDWECGMGGNGDAAPAAELSSGFCTFAAASGRLVQPLNILHATPVSFAILFRRNRLQ